MHTIQIAETDYTVDDAWRLRDDLITIRNQQLTIGNNRAAATLSHVIAFMSVAIPELWPPAINPQDKP